MQVAIGISIVGCVLAAFVPRFLRDLRLSKVNEAVQELERMQWGAAAYFALENEPTEPGGERTTHCLPEAAGPTPAEPSVDPVDLDFGDPELAGSETWRSLAFLPPQPVRFRYSFIPVEAGCGLRSPEGTYLVSMRAEGDLDGDGIRSLFERRARANDDGILVPTGILYVHDRAE